MKKKNRLFCGAKYLKITPEQSDLQILEILEQETSLACLFCLPLSGHVIIP